MRFIYSWRKRIENDQKIPAWLQNTAHLPPHSPLNTLESSKDAERNLFGFLGGIFFTLLLRGPFLLSTGAESSDETSPAFLSITDKSVILREAFTDNTLSTFSFWFLSACSCMRMSVTEFDFVGSSPPGSKLVLLPLLRFLSRPTRRRAAISAIFRVLAKTGLAGVTGFNSSFPSSITDEAVGELRSLSPSSVKLRSFFVLLGVGKGSGELENEIIYCHYGFHNHEEDMSRNDKKINHAKKKLCYCCSCYKFTFDCFNSLRSGNKEC